MVKKIIGKSYLALILLLLYAPILILMAFSFTDTQTIGTWDSFTIDLYLQLFKNEEIMEALLNTVLIAVASATCSTILGTLGAIGAYYSGKKMKKMVNFFNQIPVLNAEIVTAIALTILFVALGIEFNFLTLLVGHMVLTIPFVFLSVLPKLEQLDPNSYEAALDLGATPRQALWKVIIPEIAPGILSGFLLCITLSLDDYIITAFTRNNSFTTLSTYIYGVTAKRGALPPTLRALTTIIMIVMAIVLIVLNLRVKKKEIK